MGGSGSKEGERERGTGKCCAGDDYVNSSDEYETETDSESSAPRRANIVPPTRDAPPPGPAAYPYPSVTRRDRGIAASANARLAVGMKGDPGGGKTDSRWRPAANTADHRINRPLAPPTRKGYISRDFDEPAPAP
eukprot:Hpha_TRINITY_DN7577_c0_g1::TRINITY_DN7577_c0_g1_i1::g.18777::m.18777